MSPEKLKDYSGGAAPQQTPPFGPKLTAVVCLRVRSHAVTYHFPDAYVGKPLKSATPPPRRAMPLTLCSFAVVQSATHLHNLILKSPQSWQTQSACPSSRSRAPSSNGTKCALTSSYGVRRLLSIPGCASLLTRWFLLCRRALRGYLAHANLARRRHRDRVVRRVSLHLQTAALECALIHFFNAQGLAMMIESDFYAWSSIQPLRGRLALHIAMAAGQTPAAAREMAEIDRSCVRRHAVRTESQTSGPTVDLPVMCTDFDALYAYLTAATCARG